MVFIKMVLNGFNVYKMYKTPIFLANKRFQVNIYTVMFKKRFINILQTNLFAENIY